MEFVLSQPTAQKLQDLIGDTGQTYTGPRTAGSGQRQLAYVECETWDHTTHQGTGVVAQQTGTGWEYTGTAADMLLLSANDEKLTPGVRYLCLRFGNYYGKDIFEAVAVAAPSQKYPLGNPCLVRDGYGNIVGIAQRWVQPDGSVKCVLSGDCGGEGCDGGDVPPPPPPPPPPPAMYACTESGCVVDSEGTYSTLEACNAACESWATYNVFVQVYEHFATDGICMGGTEPGTYSVSVASSTEGSQVIPVGGAWFTGIPFGTDSVATLSYGGSSSVFYWVGGMSCSSGSASTGAGTSCTINGSVCEFIGVSFTIGNCGPTPTPGSTTDVIAIETVEGGSV